MVIYVEYVIIDNMVFDCLILYAVSLTLKLQSKRWRIILGGAVGTLTAALTVYIKDVWGIVLKLACLVLMCMTVCGVGKKLFWHILLSAAYTFILGGVIFGLFFLCGVEFSAGLNVAYMSEIPLGIYVAAVAAFVFLVYCITAYIKNARHRAPFIKKIKVLLEGESVDCYGFLDSGNTLRHNGLPVCFAMKSLFDKASQTAARGILSGKVECIELETVGGKQKVIAVNASINLDGKEISIYLALPKTKNDTEYAVLLNAAMLEVQNETDELSEKSA